MVITFVQVLVDGSPPGAGAQEESHPSSGTDGLAWSHPRFGQEWCRRRGRVADPTAPMVAPTPSEVTERAASSVAVVEQPAEGRILPVEAVVTMPSQDQPGAVVVALEGVVQSVPLGA